MKQQLALLALALIPSAAMVVDDTFDSVRADFRSRVSALLGEQDLSTEELSSSIAAAAEATFGAHSDLMRGESEARLGRLPALSAVDLDSYEELASETLPPLPPEAQGEWLAMAWDPGRVAEWARVWVLARQLGPEELSRRVLLSSYCPDEVHRLGDAESPTLVVDSLGELFVVALEWTDRGVGRPVSVRWLRRK